MTTGRINQVAAETRDARSAGARASTEEVASDAATACNRVCVWIDRTSYSGSTSVCVTDRLTVRVRVLHRHSSPGRDTTRKPSRSRAVFCSPSEFPLCGFGIFKTSDGHRNNVFF
jgi:hypothetical protein